jgi:galactokinase
MVEKIRNKFKELFGAEPVLVQSPGRINLIGEHTDYNMGFVMPSAIDQYIWFALAPNGTGVVRAFAIDQNQKIEFPIEDTTNALAGWGMYIKGMSAQFRGAISGYDVVFGGNIPQGGGMSSSAALCCGLGFGINHIFEVGKGKWDLAKMGQKAEQEYARVDCGIMDQFASLFSAEDTFSVLDCRSLEFQQNPWNPANCELLLVDTKVKHSLAQTEYNIRKQDCDLATSLISQQYEEVSSLRDVTPDMLKACEKSLGERLTRRVKFVVEENSRVVRGLEAIKSEDYATFGQLMYESHEGLSQLYSVSCDELDFLVKESLEHSEILGARMMGGGFGGCTLNLVASGTTEDLVPTLRKAYFSQYHKDPAFYPVKLAGGTQLL